MMFGYIPLLSPFAQMMDAWVKDQGGFAVMIMVVVFVYAYIIVAGAVSWVMSLGTAKEKEME